MPRRVRISTLVLLLILAFTAAVRLWHLNAPFRRNPEGCAAFFGLLARNYFRFDWSSTFGLPVQSMGLSTEPVVYANHPPLAPILIAGVYRLCGYRGGPGLPGDWQLRLPTALFTLGCILLIYRMTRRRSTERAALLAAAIFAAAPITLIYGGFADVINPQLLFFALLSVAAYLRLHAAACLKNLLLLILAFIPAALTDWPAFHLVVVFAAHFALTHPPRRWWWMIAFGCIAAGFFALLYLQAVAATGDWHWIMRLVQRRALSAVADNSGQFTWSRWFAKAIAGHAARLHTPAMLVLALAWSAAIPWRWKRWTDADRLASLLLAWALVHIIVGRQGVFVHEWWWWPLTPGVAVAAALVLDRLGDWIAQSSVQRRGVNATIVVGLAVFAAWNARSAMIELRRDSPIAAGPLNYTVQDLGEAVRAAVPPDTAIILAESDVSLPLWYYADRPMKMNVWDPLTFEHRIADGTTDLCFGITQPWRGPTGAAIIPKAYLSGEVRKLADYLSRRYPSRDTPKFLVFDLWPMIPSVNQAE